jgi:diaminopimelate epimerase
VKLLCDRHFGVGGDGLLFGPVGPVTRGRPIELRIFNPDGHECERSGNGIRMFALYVAEFYLKERSFVVRTLAGGSPVQVVDLDAGMVQVDMGRPSFDAARIPVSGMPLGPVIARPLIVDGRSLTVTCVNVGNPHTVVLMSEISAGIAEDLGPKIARHPQFPAGTNVQFLQVLDRSTIRIEIYERGAGYTLASGTSSCAAASAAHALGLVDREICVEMPGGTLDIAIGTEGSITMTGAAQQVARGDFAPALRK